MKVVDASVLVEFLAEGQHQEAAELAIRPERWLWVPTLIDAEVGQSLRRQVRNKEISARVADKALVQMSKLPLERIPPDALVERAWQLRQNVTFYDALYVALAEELGVPLLTFDGHLARAPGLAGTVELLAPV